MWCRFWNRCLFFNEKDNAYCGDARNCCFCFRYVELAKKEKNYRGLKLRWIKMEVKFDNAKKTSNFSAIRAKN